MNKIRIGKDIRVEWQLTATDPSIELNSENITLEMTTPSKEKVIIESSFSNGVLSANIYGTSQKQLGSYWLTAWYKRDEVGQSMIDKVQAFTLVPYTDLEDDNDESIAYGDVELEGEFTVGIKGEKGDTGNGIQSIDVVESSQSGGSNLVTINMTDGTSTNFTVKNGNDGNYNNTNTDVIFIDSGKLKLHTTEDYNVTINTIYTEQDPTALDDFYDTQFLNDSCLATGALIHQILESKLGTISTVLNNILG